MQQDSYLYRRIDTFADILTALDTEPQLAVELGRRIIPEELANLPARFDEFVQRFDEFVKEHTEFAETTNRRLLNLEATTSRLEATTQRLEATTSRLEATTQRLEDKTQQMEATTSRLEATTQRLEDKTQRLDDNLADLIGSELERRTHRNIRFIARNEMGLNQTQVLLSISHDLGEVVEHILENAESSGRITPEQTRDLLRTDLILRAHRIADGKIIYVVIEVSRTVNRRDITRARTRADTLAVATGTDTLAAAVGKVIQPPQRAMAETEQVQVILFEPDEDEDEETD